MKPSSKIYFCALSLVASCCIAADKGSNDTYDDKGGGAGIDDGISAAARRPYLPPAYRN